MIQIGDFVKIEYTGKLEDGSVFDTTQEMDGYKLGPVTICVGEKQIFEKIENEMIGKNEGDEFSIELSPDEAFGKKDPKLIQLIATSKFTKNNIKPVPGLRVNVDGMEGVVKSSSGGRTIVDFNHPLSGKNVHYDIKILEIVKDDKEKIKGFLKLTLRKELDFELNENQITFKENVPDEILEYVEKELKRLLKREISCKSLNKSEENNN